MVVVEVAQGPCKAQTPVLGLAYMASQTQPFLAERVDIHKSCKSLETLLSVLNDYCEAAGAVVLLQKKLAKALRETASMKVTGEVAANAMNTSATIFDALSDVDTKFAKIADKEYDGISAEVKKWFKKLAKEEKAHDERLSNANAKIKQAGQTYEKKSKKSPRDAAEEHARYINLISSLGPEISQDKYNHSLQVTQRHTSTTYSVAACVSRVADAEWLRNCESVRRVSPSIGPLGEWRSLCEGGWTGALPQSLVDPDPDPEQPQSPEQESRGEETMAMRNVRPKESNPAFQSRDQTPAITPLASPNPGRVSLPHMNQSSPPSSFDPPRPLVDPNSGSQLSQHAPSQPSQQSSSSSASNSNLAFPTTQAETLLEPERQVDEPSSMPPSPNPNQYSPNPNQSAESKQTNAAPVSLQDDVDIKRPIPVRSQTVDSPNQPKLDRISSPAGSISRTLYPRGDYVEDERDFGTVSKVQSDVPDNAQWNGVERSDTGGSTGSVVAAMRNRYSSTSGATSPPPKDIPRLPLSVTDLATRYQPLDTSPVSPRARAASPPCAGSSLTHDRNVSGGYNPARSSIPSPSTSRSAAEEEAARRRSQHLDRLDQAAELELLEKEKALQEKEREISMRAKELEIERANLRNIRADGGQRDAWENGTTSPKPQLRPRERKTSFRNSPLPRPQSQLETRVPSGNMGNVANNLAHSYSTTHLVPPSASQSTSSSTSDDARTKHAPYCGCETCSVAQYKSPSNRSPSPHDLRPPEKPITLRPVEKPKGWIRRLSMPSVGNAFSLDKKSSVPKMYSLDANKRNANGSSTTLRTVDEDGRIPVAQRRSYDASGISNRSMTNLSGLAGVGVPRR
ncbi:hypothetical protein MSAN_00370600 [Mycena sanguinolenta]|uniref:Uncharacterized protein n=1 Tax=Mycena sanguinolenta TaxID=230812 RepID=A0A8H7DKR4_9AGAR|nr:hypothetical protein MSAN_00370600 [Mycena sanguinolenta]